DISDVNFTTTTYVGGPALVSVDSLTLIGESCTPTNNAVDPGETVQVRLGLRNIGNQNATNVTANLVADSGVLSPSGAQSYGTLTANGSAVTKDFSFTAMGTCGGTLPVRFEIRTNGVVSRVHTNIFFLGGYNLVTQARSNVSMINLPDGNASPYPSIINVSGLTGVIEKVTVTLTGLSHTWPADLDMVLVGPQGQNVMLMSDAGGSGQLNSVNLTFDDAAAASLPSGGGIPSGTYKPTDHPGSDSDLFPSGPVGPFGSVLSVFKDTQPNGNWALYIRDQYIDDTGNISGGWRLNIITRVPECCGGNVHAPVLAAIANRTVHVGSTLTITNTATDLDTPSHLLTYSLVTAPTGASIGNSSGILTWVPTQGQLGTHAFSVRVSDNGNPNLTDTKNFSVSVIDRPLQNSSISGNQFALQWSAISGRSYQVQMKTNLNQASWLNVGVITATGSTATFVEPPTSQQKYFRIIALD
ncbi:MAG: putative Ig domain-containing protein, partial [Limisphaerales bacterium]